MFKKVVSVLSVSLALILTGCGMSEITSSDMAISQSMEESRAACYESRKVDISNVPKEQKALVAQSKMFSDALLAIAGKDPCRTTNVYDAKIAEVRSKNEAVSKGVGVAGSVVKNGVFGVAAVEVVKHSGSTYNADGESTISATNENGSRNTVGITDDSFNASTTGKDSPASSVNDGNYNIIPPEGNGEPGIEMVD